MQQSKLGIVKNLKEEKTDNLSSGSLFINHISRSFDYIAILRPLLLIPGWTMVFLGYYRGVKDGLANHIYLPIIGNTGIIVQPQKEILLTLLLYSLLMGAIYILNQITDSNTDNINGKLYLVPHGYLNTKILKFQIIIFLSISLILAIINFSRIYSVFVLLSIIMGIMYSVPPIRLKGKPIIDLISNALGFGFVAFAVGWTSKSEFSINLMLDSLPYFLCVSSAFINTTIPDMDGDIRNGDVTTGVFLGISKACLLSTLILIFAIIAGWLRKDFVPVTASILSLPFFIYMMISNWKNKNIKAITIATKVSVMALSLLVAVLMPFYFVLLILTIVLVRIYYQLRFGISYP